MLFYVNNNILNNIHNIAKFFIVFASYIISQNVATLTAV